MGAEWSPDLTVNHDLLDEQHVDVFRRIRDAGAALDGARASLEAAVASLAEALLAHVAVEERLMEETLYPERTRHRSAHEMFMADLAQMRAELQQKGPTPLVAQWIRVRIPEWLEFHIRVNDVPFGDFLARRRSQQAGEVRPRGDGGRRLS